MKQRKRPNYKLIYSDLIAVKYPLKKKYCESILSKDVLTVLDIIKINNIIFGKSSVVSENSSNKFKNYDLYTILEILQYQKDHNLSNIQTANKFDMSRNTIASWKKRFL